MARLGLPAQQDRWQENSIPTKWLFAYMSQLPNLNHSQKSELLMVGMSAKTYRNGNTVIKIPRIDEEDSITIENFKAVRNEASIYTLLGEHRGVAKCLGIGPAKDYVLLEFYPNGTLKGYIDNHRTSITDVCLKRWARQTIEGALFIHAQGVRHSDLRLDQWLLDDDLNARLCDFDGSGYDPDPALGLEGSRALGNEISSHYLPRDPVTDSTVESDLFALGSVLYELVAGQRPYESLDDQTTEMMYRQGSFPNVEGLLLGDIILRCWRGEFSSAQEVLHLAEKLYEL